MWLLPLEADLVVPVSGSSLNAIGQAIPKTEGRQTIVILIDSTAVHSKVLEEWIATMRQHHELVAWVKKPSAKASLLAMLCHKRFITQPALSNLAGVWPPVLPCKTSDLGGWISATLYSGINLRHDPMLNWRPLMEWARIGSFDRDEARGVRTFIADLSGEFLFCPLKEDDEAALFSQLRGINFVHGIANDTNELAGLLDMNRWQEASELPRVEMNNWRTLASTAEREIAILIKQINQSGGQARKALMQSLREWYDKCPEVTLFLLPPYETLVLEDE